MPDWLSVTLLSLYNVMHTSEPLFFIVSGFILANFTAQKMEHIDLGSGTSMFLRRLARLLPAYYLALMATVVLDMYSARVHKSESDGILHWASQATLSQSLVPLESCTPGPWFPFDGNGIGWFTSAIVVLSLCFIPIFNVICNFHLAAAGLWLILFASLRSLCVQFAPSYASLIHVYAPWHLFPFVMGMLCSQLCRKAHSIMGWFHWGLVLDGVFAAWVAGSFFWAPKAAWTRAHQRFHMVWLCADCLLCIAAYGVALSTEMVKDKPLLTRMYHRGIMGNVMSNSVLTYWADNSFAAYILQNVVFRGLEYTWRYS